MLKAKKWPFFGKLISKCKLQVYIEGLAELILMSALIRIKTRSQISHSAFMHSVADYVIIVILHSVLLPIICFQIRISADKGQVCIVKQLYDKTQTLPKLLLT